MSKPHVWKNILFKCLYDQSNGRLLQWVICSDGIDRFLRKRLLVLLGCGQAYTGTPKFGAKLG